jgi:hypothetical protein
MTVYQLHCRFLGSKTGADLVFTTGNGEKVTHVGVELEKLSEFFGKKFTVTPTMNRKQMASSVNQSGTDADVRATASYMSHSLEVHKAAYQQKANTEKTVSML